MTYPKTPNLHHQINQINDYVLQKHEFGSRNIEPILAKIEKELNKTINKLQRLPIDLQLEKKEPSDLKSILALRPHGPRKMWATFDEKAYRDRLAGAFLGRIAGCTLGAPVECWTVEKMVNLARENQENFPPVDYWKRVPDPFEKRYNMSERREYDRMHLNGVPVDDDIVYTLLGLLVVEEYGADFTVAENGKAWLKYLPYACTAEDVALKNLKAGIPAKSAGAKNNPFCEWIGADIRSDPWAYMAPAWPERAADLAFRDAYLSHRRSGIFGEMFFSAAISAAFAVDDPIEALRIGLTEIPCECRLARDIAWALKTSKSIKNYRDARKAVDARFKGMHHIHTNNNACLTVFGITIGKRDFTRVIGETVAMGMDNDCTAATAGSIVGAVVGKKGIPSYWYKRFNNQVRSYLIRKPEFHIDDLLRRFEKQAARIYKVNETNLIA